MTKLWLMLICATAIAYFIQKRDRRLLEEDGGKRDRVFTLILIIVLASLPSLRTAYNDTFTYLNSYNNITDTFFERLQVIDWNPGANPGFRLTNVLLHDLKFSPQSFLMIYSVSTLLMYVLFLRNTSRHFALSVFFLITMGCYTFTFAAIKQCFAMALCLIAILMALKKKWSLFALLIFVATFFHPYSLIFLAVPLMMFKPWTGRTYIFLAVFAVAGILLEVLVDSMISITQLIGDDYTAESLLGEGVNGFRFLVYSIPTAISFIYRKSLFYDSTKEENLMVNLSMLSAEIMFMGLFGTANYFARLASFFLPMQAVALPWMLRRADSRNRDLLTWCAIFGFTLYFFFAHSIKSHFNTIYQGISIIDYISELFR